MNRRSNFLKLLQFLSANEVFDRTIKAQFVVRLNLDSFTASMLGKESKLRVLAVEDDPHMLDLLCQGLREIGHTVMPALDGTTGLALACQVDFDAVILDIGLPERDGYEVTRALRSLGRRVHILMLTARDAEEDILRGFDVGADDYLIKPFSFAELVARLHRFARPEQSKLRTDENLEIRLDHGRLAALRGNAVIPLSRAEFLLLAALLEHAGGTATRQSLSEAVWGKCRPVQANSLDVLVNSLRGKVDAFAGGKLIITVRGIGYRLQSDAPCQSFDTDRQKLSA